MDKKGEIDFLSSLVKPDIGIITNVSYAHAKNFKNINHIALAKSEIINNTRVREIATSVREKESLAATRFIGLEDKNVHFL